MLVNWFLLRRGDIFRSAQLGRGKLQQYRDRGDVIHICENDFIERGTLGTPAHDPSRASSSYVIIDIDVEISSYDNTGLLILFARRLDADGAEMKEIIRVSQHSSGGGHPFSPAEYLGHKQE